MARKAGDASVGYFCAAFAIFCWIQFFAALSQNDSLILFGKVDGGVSYGPAFALGFIGAPLATIFALIFLRRKPSGGNYRATSKPSSSSIVRLLLIVLGIIGVIGLGVLAMVLTTI